MKLLERIERHLKETHMSATRFGRRAVGDPRFVLDLRMGRRPRRRTLEKVEHYLQNHEPPGFDEPLNRPDLPMDYASTTPSV